MSEFEHPVHSSRREEAARRILEDIRQLEAARAPGTGEEEEMLSLLLEEASQGTDIARQFPGLYQELLTHPELRQAFLDLLDALDEDETESPLPAAVNDEVDLGFLREEEPPPVVGAQGEGWTVRWQRTAEALQSLFTPSQPVYRASPAFTEDLWFTLVRDEVSIESLRYAIALECTFSEDADQAFSPFLSIAVTVESGTAHPPFPLRSSLQWGPYRQTITISGEGRSRFPDLPLHLIYDEEYRNLHAPLHLTLERLP